MLYEFAEAEEFALIFAYFFDAEHVAWFDDDLLVLEAFEIMGGALQHRPDFHFHYNLILYNCYPQNQLQRDSITHPIMASLIPSIVLFIYSWFISICVNKM